MMNAIVRTLVFGVPMSIVMSATIPYIELRSPLLYGRRLCGFRSLDDFLKVKAESIVEKNIITAKLLTQENQVVEES